jgi:hypothetical protein
MYNTIINNEDIDSPALLTEMKACLDLYKTKSLREIKGMFDSKLTENHKVLIITREKDLLMFCFKMENFFTGKGDFPEKNYYREDFKKLFLFTIKEDLISYIRKACINPQELLLKNNELIKKLELISELFERD